MFTYIKTRNYKSLGEFELNLINKKKQAKKLAIIYGENGAGKSDVYKRQIIKNNSRQ